MPKFSDLVSVSDDAKLATVDAQIALDKAKSADVQANASVVSALKTQTPPIIAIPGVNGSTFVYSLTSDGENFTSQNIAGDFDVPEPDPVDPVDPEPAALAA